MGQFKVSPHHPETSGILCCLCFFINNAATVFQPLFLKRSFFFADDMSHVITSLIWCQRLKTDRGSHYQLVYNLAVINECLSTRWEISFHSPPPKSLPAQWERATEIHNIINYYRLAA